MKPEVLVYASGRRGTLDKSGIAGSAGHLSPSALPRLLGSGRGGPWRHQATGCIWLWLFPLWAPLHQRVKQTTAFGAVVALQPEAARDTRVTEQGGFKQGRIHSPERGCLRRRALERALGSAIVG